MPSIRPKNQQIFLKNFKMSLQKVKHLFQFLLWWLSHASHRICVPSFPLPVQCQHLKYDWQTIQLCQLGLWCWRTSKFNDRTPVHLHDEVHAAAYCLNPRMHSHNHFSEGGVQEDFESVVATYYCEILALLFSYLKQPCLVTSFFCLEVDEPMTHIYFHSVKLQQ